MNIPIAEQYIGAGQMHLLIVIPQLSDKNAVLQFARYYQHVFPAMSALMDRLTKKRKIVTDEYVMREEYNSHYCFLTAMSIMMMPVCAICAEQFQWPWRIMRYAGILPMCASLALFVNSEIKTTRVRNKVKHLHNLNNALVNRRFDGTGFNVYER